MIDFLSANVPDEESPLASGVSPAREAGSAGDMPEVPKGRGFAPSVCSISFLFEELDYSHYRDEHNADAAIEEYVLNCDSQWSLSINALEDNSIYCLSKVVEKQETNECDYRSKENSVSKGGLERIARWVGRTSAINKQNRAGDARKQQEHCHWTRMQDYFCEASIHGETILLSNVQAHLRLPVARFLHGAKRQQEA